MADRLLRRSVQPATGDGTVIPPSQTTSVLVWKSNLRSSTETISAFWPPVNPGPPKPHRHPHQGGDSLSLYGPDWVNTKSSLRLLTQNS